MFSETNKFLYLNIGFKWLYQLDVDPDSPDFGIWNLIYELDNTFEYKIGQLQMGPDKKFMHQSLMSHRKKFILV